MSETHLSSVDFASLDLPETIMQGVREAGFIRCTPIQAQTLPVALEGIDVAGQAQTGTGKTAAFLLALFARLLKTPASPERRNSDPRAFILAPTRELALQIHDDAQILGEFTGLSIGLAYGGTDYDKQRAAIEAGIDVLIGTPGRLIDYLKQKVYTLNFVEVCVLDEADRMFDLGFIKDIRYLLRRMPAPDKRLNMLFSATLSQRVLELAYEHMNDPRLVRIESDKITADNVTQIIYFPSNREKMPLLINLLKSQGLSRTMIFVNTRRAADLLQRTLEANGLQAKAISGDVPQRKRQSMLKQFQNGDLPILIGTDVASRGLHVPDVSHVFNYDLPQDREDYVHRIGRTARAGATGDAISFGCEDYVATLPDIEDFIGYKIPVAAIDPASLGDVVKPAPKPRSKNPRPHGKRSSGGGGRPGGSGRRR